MCYLMDRILALEEKYQCPSSISLVMDEERLGHWLESVTKFFSVFLHCWLGDRKDVWPIKIFFTYS